MSSAGLVLAAVLTLAAPPPSSGAPADDLLRGPDGALGSGLEPFYVTRTDWNPESIRFELRTKAGEKMVLKLTAPDADDAGDDLVLKRYAVAVTVEPPDARERLAADIQRVLDRLKDQQERGPTLGKPRGPSHLAANEQLWISWILLVLGFLLFLPMLLREAGRTLFELAPDRRSMAWPAVILAGVVIVQVAIVPQILATGFGAYRAVAEAFALEPNAKYGAAATALYGPLLRLFGVDAMVVVRTNLVLGLLAVPLAGVLAARLGAGAGGKDEPRGDWLTGVFALAIYGLSPVLLRDRATESILVPLQLYFLAAALHLDAWLRTERRRGWLHLAGAVVFAALALNTRPEAVVALPFLMLIVLALPGRFARLRAVWPLLVLAVVVTVALYVPRIITMLAYVRQGATEGDVPGLSEHGWLRFGTFFLTSNALWLPQVHIIAQTLLAVIALFLVPRKGRLSAILLFVLILSWQLVTTLDLPRPSIPRLQAPALSWVALLAAIVPAVLLRAGSRWRQILGVVALAAALLPWPYTIDSLWQRTNAREFNDVWPELVAGVEPSTADRCVVALCMADEPEDIVLRHYPLYDIDARSGRVREFCITTFLQNPEALWDAHCEPLYLMGPQCWARHHLGRGRPAELEEHPRCREMREKALLDPIAERQLPNRGDVEFDVWGKSPTVPVGLYHIRRPPPAP